MHNDVSEEHVTRIFRSKNKLSTYCLPPVFILVSYLAYSSILKMEVIFSSETLVDSQRTKRLDILEDRTLHYHCYNSNPIIHSYFL
jgi:hypothetical protein